MINPLFLFWNQTKIDEFHSSTWLVHNLHLSISYSALYKKYSVFLIPKDKIFVKSTYKWISSKCGIDFPWKHHSDRYFCQLSAKIQIQENYVDFTKFFFSNWVCIKIRYWNWILKFSLGRKPIPNSNTFPREKINTKFQYLPVDLKIHHLTKSLGDNYHFH